MTVQDKRMRRLRIVILAFVGMLLVATISMIDSASVKAPLLTMLGGGTIIVTLYPPRTLTVQDAGTLLGTGIAISGGAYWLIGEMERAPPNELFPVSILASILVVLLFSHISISMLILADWTVIWNGVRSGIKAAVRRITRR